MFGTRSSPRKQTLGLGSWSWISHWAGGNKGLNSGAKRGGETPGKLQHPSATQEEGDAQAAVLAPALVKTRNDSPYKDNGNDSVHSHGSHKERKQQPLLSCQTCVF